MLGNIDSPIINAFHEVPRAVRSIVEGSHTGPRESREQEQHGSMRNQDAVSAHARDSP